MNVNCSYCCSYSICRLAVEEFVFKHEVEVRTMDSIDKTPPKTDDVIKDTVNQILNDEHLKSWANEAKRTLGIYPPAIRLAIMDNTKARLLQLFQVIHNNVISISTRKQNSTIYVIELAHHSTDEVSQAVCQILVIPFLDLWACNTEKIILENNSHRFLIDKKVTVGLHTFMENLTARSLKD